MCGTKDGVLRCSGLGPLGEAGLRKSDCVGVGLWEAEGSHSGGEGGTVWGPYGPEPLAPQMPLGIAEMRVLGSTGSHSGTS